MFLYSNKICSIIQKGINEIQKDIIEQVLLSNLFRNSFHQNENHISKILHVMVSFQFALYFVYISFKFVVPFFGGYLMEQFFFQNRSYIPMLKTRHT